MLELRLLCVLLLTLSTSSSAEETYFQLIQGTNNTCSITAIRDPLNGFEVELQEVAQSVYKLENRIRDGFRDTENICLYQTRDDNVQGPIVALVERDAKISGVIAFSRHGQFLVPEQEVRKSGQNLRLLPFSEHETVFDPDDIQAKNKQGDFNEMRNLELYAISDKRMVEEDGPNLLPNMLVTLSVANQILRSVGLRLTLAVFTDWRDKNIFEITRDINLTLENLSSYRFRLNPSTTPKHDSMHLFTGEEQDSRGKAYINGMCKHYLGVSTTSVAHRQNLISRAVAFVHEISHLLGSIHDEPSWRENPNEYKETCHCPDSECVMTPALPDPGPIRFSNCTMRTILQNVHHYESQFNCLLDNRDSDLLCPWVDRPDVPDHCCIESTTQNNKTSFIQKPNDSPCDNEQGRCMNGFCNSLDSQCRRAFGLNFLSAPRQYYVVNGGRPWSSGHCSYNAKELGPEHFDFDTKTCSSEDRECGALICTDGTMENQVDLSKYNTVMKHHLSIRGQDKVFISGIDDTELSGVRDPLLVSNGTRCGIEGYCNQGKCVQDLNSKVFW